MQRFSKRQPTDLQFSLAICRSDLRIAIPICNYRNLVSLKGINVLPAVLTIPTLFAVFRLAKHPAQTPNHTSQDRCHYVCFP